MAKITLVRVDHRLIHGQVITKWVKIAQAQKIIIVDDFLGQDEFMADIYRMAAPSGVEVAILTAEDAGQAFQNNTLGDKNIFILFKNVDMANKAYKAGLKYEKIQLGGISSVTVLAIILSGIIGAVMGPTICKIFKIKDSVAVGISLGTAAHAVGTTKALEIGETEGAMSGLSIGVAGIMTVFIAPLAYNISLYIHSLIK